MTTTSTTPDQSANVTTTLDERGSLILIHSTGDEKTPETYTVQLRDEPWIMGSLEVAREFFTLGAELRRLNGSQAVTVKAWHEEYLG